MNELIKKRTVYWQLAVTMTTIVIVLVMFFALFNGFMLKRYLIYDKQKSLVEVYHYVDTMITEETVKNGIAEEIQFELIRMCDTENLKLYYTVENQDTAWEGWTGASPDVMRAELNVLMHGGAVNENMDVLEETDTYRIVRRTDSRTKTDYMFLFGVFGDGDSEILLVAAIENSERSATITTRFFLIIALIALVISFFVIMVLSRRISSPIRRLSNISLRMKALDFDTKYEASGADCREIRELGTSMNEMALSLEETIAELKSANIELKRDIQRKEEIDEMRKEFLSNVSHELKTPLALIRGYAEGLKEGLGDDADSREYYCDVICDESDKMNQMVKQLLKLNEIEFGQNQLEMSRFNLTELIKGVLSTNHLLLQEADTKVIFDEGAVYIWADEFQVEQVITNYLTNAIHYVDDNKEIRIRYEENDDVVRVLVFNSGAQIPEESLERLWEKFYKVDQARTREYGGNGIGLSIVRAIMKAHGRACGVINQENGVEFWAEFDVNLEK